MAMHLSIVLGEIINFFQALLVTGMFSEKKYMHWVEIRKCVYVNRTIRTMPMSWRRYAAIHASALSF